MTDRPKHPTPDGGDRHRSPVDDDADLIMDLVGSLPGIFAWHADHPATLVGEVTAGLGFRVFGWWGARATSQSTPAPDVTWSSWTPVLAWQSPSGWGACIVELRPGMDLPPWSDCDWAPRLNMLNAALLAPFGRPTLGDLALAVAGDQDSVASAGAWRHADEVTGPVIWGLLRLMTPAHRYTTSTLLGLSRPNLLGPHGHRAIGVHEYQRRTSRRIPATGAEGDPQSI